MKNNEKIISILKKNFSNNFAKIQGYTFEKLIELLIYENPDAYHIGENRVGKLYDEEVVRNLNLTKSNQKLS
jgi:hypothetical protein